MLFFWQKTINNLHLKRFGGFNCLIENTKNLKELQLKFDIFAYLKL